MKSSESEDMLDSAINDLDKLNSQNEDFNRTKDREELSKRLQWSND